MKRRLLHGCGRGRWCARIPLVDRRCRWCDHSPFRARPARRHGLNRRLITSARSSAVSKYKTGSGISPEGTVESAAGADALLVERRFHWNTCVQKVGLERMGAQLMAMVTEGKPVGESISTRQAAMKNSLLLRYHSERPTLRLPEKALSFRVQVYGMTRTIETCSPTDNWSP